MQRVEEVNRQEGMTPEQIEEEKRKRAQSSGSNRGGGDGNIVQYAAGAPGRTMGSALDSFIGEGASVQTEKGTFTDMPGQLAGFQSKSDAAAARQRDISAMGAGRQEQVRQDQLALNQALQARMAGKTPSVAEMQMRQGQDAAMQQALAMRASARGVNAAVAQQQAADQMAALSQQAVGQTAQMRAQEQMQAEQALGSQLAGMRGQDLSQEQLSLQTQLQQQQMNDALVMKYLDAGLTMQQAQLQAQVDLEKARVEQENVKRGQRAGMVGGLMEAGAKAGTVIAMSGSDMRIKADIRGGKKDVQEFLDALEAKSWLYKDQERFGKGKHVGIMAQDAEKTKLGASMVEHDKDGTKLLDMRKGFGLALAGLAEVNQRLKKLEKKRG